MDAVERLFQDMFSQLTAGLRRRSVTTCSQWASLYRIMGQPYPGPVKYDKHPWSKRMRDHEGDWVGRKSAQGGFTEVALDRSLFLVDVRQMSVLYVLPNKTPDATDFSAARFDSALALSDYLSNLFSDTKNVGHKRAGGANLYIRGSRSKSGLKSVPVSCVIFDEYDEMELDNVPLAIERTSGQVYKQIIKISTPTVEQHGIDKEANNSTDDHFFFRCGACSKYIELDYPDSFVLCGEDYTDPRISESYVQCPQCKTKIQHESKWEQLKSGIWVPRNEGKSTQGWYINQLYSSTIEPSDFAKSAHLSRNGEADEQEFFNSKLGKAHTVANSKVTVADVEACKGTHRMTDTRLDYHRLCTLGIDVGKKLHYWVNEWIVPSSFSSPDVNMYCKPICIKMGSVVNFDELDLLMSEHEVDFAVIDAHPEKRKSEEFCHRWWGRARLCFYTNNHTSRDLGAAEGSVAVSVDRTCWLDLTMSRLKNRGIILPTDTTGEYLHHIQSIVRSYKKNKDDGTITSTYVKTDRDDHLTHAQTYAEIALRLRVSNASSSTTITTKV